MKRTRVRRVLDRISAAIKRRAYECGKQDALNLFREALSDVKADRE